MYNMVLYLCVLIMFSLHRESLKLILTTDPLPRWFCHRWPSRHHVELLSWSTSTTRSWLGLWMLSRRPTRLVNPTNSSCTFANTRLERYSKYRPTRSSFQVPIILVSMGAALLHIVARLFAPVFRVLLTPLSFQRGRQHYGGRRH
jgi:hypothetical protein